VIVGLDEVDRDQRRTRCLVVAEEDEDLSVHLGDALAPGKVLRGTGE
jgi:hypothetical protein